jgi:hypothetical protein
MHAHPDPADPDRYQFQATGKLYFFSQNFNMLYKLLKIMKPLTLTRKINHSKRAMLRLKVKRKFRFPTCVKLGVGSASRSATKWKFGFGSRSTTLLRTNIVFRIWPVLTEKGKTMHLQYFLVLPDPGFQGFFFLWGGREIRSLSKCLVLSLTHKMNPSLVIS